MISRRAGGISIWDPAKGGVEARGCVSLSFSFAPVDSPRRRQHQLLRAIFFLFNMSRITARRLFFLSLMHLMGRGFFCWWASRRGCFHRRRMRIADRGSEVWIKIESGYISTCVHTCGPKVYVERVDAYGLTLAPTPTLAPGLAKWKLGERDRWRFCSLSCFRGSIIGCSGEGRMHP